MHLSVHSGPDHHAVNKTSGGGLCDLQNEWRLQKPILRQSPSEHSFSIFERRVLEQIRTEGSGTGCVTKSLAPSKSYPRNCSILKDAPLCGKQQLFCVHISSFMERHAYGHTSHILKRQVESVWTSVDVQGDCRLLCLPPRPCPDESAWQACSHLLLALTGNPDELPSGRQGPHVQSYLVATDQVRGGAS